MAELEQPIIIKKITKVEGGHHGGAWKVAYADFVTAMMAFFLLLWLLSSASDGQLNGIADYFTPTIGLKDEMGIGFDGGESNEVEDGSKKNTLTRPGIVMGQNPQGLKPGDPKKKATLDAPDGEEMLFQQRGRAIKEVLSRNGALSKFADNVLVTETPEGLKIQLMDSDKDSMFKPGGTALSDTGKILLGKMTDILQGMPNMISITGHTDSVPFTKRPDYSNWELSSERANAARRYMMEHGMIEERVAKVQGRADKEPLPDEAPEASKNRRIEIILLKHERIEVPQADRPALGGFLSEDRRSNDILQFEDNGGVPADAPKEPVEIPVNELQNRPNLLPQNDAQPTAPSDALQYKP